MVFRATRNRHGCVSNAAKLALEVNKMEGFQEVALLEEAFKTFVKTNQENHQKPGIFDAIQQKLHLFVNDTFTCDHTMTSTQCQSYATAMGLTFQQVSSDG